MATTPPSPPPPMGVRTVRPIRLFRLLGIDVFLDWSWLLVAVLEIQFRHNTYSARGWNVLEYLTLFAIVLMHEFGHALACRSVGGRADQIILWPLGGIAYVSPPQRPGATLWSIAAGPLVNVVLLPVSIAVWFGTQALGGLSHDAQHYVTAVAWINVALLAYNILPIYPLDGGQMLRSVLWFFVGRGRSLQVASLIGFAGAAGLAYLAWSQHAWWFGLMAVFNVQRSYKAFQESKVLRVLEAMPRRAGVACPQCHASPPRERIWRSPCGHAVDAFAGPCFTCGEPIDPVGCPDCGRASPAAAWGATG